MADLDAMATFSAVVRAGSFAGAARALRVPRSTVSQRVARLEESLGVRLLERTTRVVRATAAGVAYAERCARILADVEAAHEAVAEMGRGPGTLRVAAPVLFAHAFLARIAATFLVRHPDVAIEIIATDRPVRLVEDGFDLALVPATAADDSSLVMRKVGFGELWCCATPGYLDARGRPRAPEALVTHDCIVHGERRATTWSFERGRATRPVRIKGRLSVSSLGMVRDAALGGAGIACIPRFVCAEDVREGRLVRVLSEWTIGRVDLRLVYPSRKIAAPRVRAFVEAVVSDLRGRAALG